jgi:hypothetical protein
MGCENTLPKGVNGKYLVRSMDKTCGPVVVKSCRQLRPCGEAVCVHLR